MSLLFVWGLAFAMWGLCKLQDFMNEGEVTEEDNLPQGFFAIAVIFTILYLLSDNFANFFDGLLRSALLKD